MMKKNNGRYCYRAGMRSYAGLRQGAAVGFLPEFMMRLVRAWPMVPHATIHTAIFPRRRAMVLASVALFTVPVAMGVTMASAADSTNLVSSAWLSRDYVAAATMVAQTNNNTIGQTNKPVERLSIIEMPAQMIKYRVNPYRVGFYTKLWGGAWLPLAPLKFEQYKDDYPIRKDVNNAPSEKLKAYDERLLADRASASLKGDMAYGGGITLGYDFANVNISLEGNIGYMNQGASWSKDYSSEEIFIIAGSGLVNQAWRVKSNNLLLSAGAYYNFLLGSYVAVSFGADVGMNYYIGNINYDGDGKAVFITGGEQNVTNLINISQSGKLSGIQGYVAPRLNLDFYVPLYGTPTNRGLPSGIIVNLYTTYYYPFNNATFNYTTQFYDLDGNLTNQKVTRSGQISNIAAGLGFGGGFALQF